MRGGETSPRHRNPSLLAAQPQRRSSVEVTLLVADSATDHKDGTFSALRAGITEVTGPAGQSVKFNIAIILRVWFEASEHAAHKANISIRDQDGKAIGGQANIDMAPPSAVSAGGAPIILNFSGVFPPGHYEVNAVVDGQRRAVWPLALRAQTAAEAA